MPNSATVVSLGFSRENPMSVPRSTTDNSLQQRDNYDIFISYSRRDKEFVSQLCEALTQANQKIWVDWNDIPPAEDWRQEIYRGIEAANNFVFIISAHSTSSEVCSDELDHAIKHGKRLVPILRQDVGYENVHPELGRINWIFFQEDDDFDGAFRKLLSAIETDLSYVREHTHLLVRARKWEKEGRNKSYLLQGSELKKAEQWLAEGESKQPQATALHREYINTSRQVETERQDAEMRLRRLTPQQVKNRQAILNKVRKFWVEGVLETSLHDKVLIELGLEERADAVVSSWNLELETADEAQKPLPKGTKVISVFDQLGEGRTLLILGEPGAGKTTTLLELTRDLINRAEQGLDYRIPVVFNLSSWAAKKQTIADWLVEELNSKYQVPKSIGQDWVKKQELLLLLDGLDEVKAEQHRNTCVAALNDFHQNSAPEMVVCSRIKDYSALSNRLNFQSAIYLKSLTPEQVRHYLDRINADLTGLRALIEGDRALQELGKSPLMLNIMVLAYEGVAVEDLPKTEVVEERRKQLFDAYIERMFRRPTRLKAEQRYSEAQTKHWLTWLAQRMVQNSQTIFLIERISLNWLTEFKQKLGYIFTIFLTGGIISGLGCGLLTSIYYNVSVFSLISNFLVFALCFILVGGVIFGLNINRIEPVIRFQWSWIKFRKNIVYGLIIGLVSAIIYGIIIGISSQFNPKFMNGTIGGLFIGFAFIMLQGLTGSVVETSNVPNQGIWQSIQNTMLLTFIAAMTWATILKIMINFPIFCSVIAGILLGVFSPGGIVCIQHLVFRFFLYFNGYIPWNYASFLDYTTELIFFQKIGGGYIFIHRLLLEHFAQMKLEK